MHYEPPPGLGPAQVGTLVDERVDMRDLTAAVVDLAIRGHLRIETEESKLLGLFPRQEFALVRLQPPEGTAPLAAHEGALLGGLFERSERVELADLRERMRHRSGGLVQCGDWALAYCIFSMEPDGSGVRKLTKSKEGEWDPVLMNDGTIMFTRWEYVMRFWRPTQMIWTIRPDGTNPRMIYGADLTQLNQYPKEICFASSRQVPGSMAGKLVSIGAQHHKATAAARSG